MGRAEVKLMDRLDSITGAVSLSPPVPSREGDRIDAVVTLVTEDRLAYRLMPVDMIRRTRT